MKWQEKVKTYRADRRISWRTLAEIIGITNTALASALNNDNAWGTVQTAIRLAQEMGTTVEYLFAPDTDWPPAPLIRPATQDERQMAIAALESLKATDALERIAGGTPPIKHASEKETARKSRSRPK